MSNNLIQYASFLVAAGCDLNFDTSNIEVTVVNFPAEDYKRRAVTLAIEDISKFLDTSNRSDGLAALHLCRFVDLEPNPIPEEIRTRILNGLGVMAGSKFVSQILLTAKGNRSWHTSDEPNTCTYFGELCTHRGIQQTNRSGLKSHRTPDQYHSKLRSGIQREQLVTPNIDAAYKVIPPSMLTSRSISLEISAFFDNIEADQLDSIIDRLKAARSR